MRLVLIPQDGGKAVPIDKAIIFFGRGPECDVVLSESRKVSRKHCCIAQIDNEYLIRDLGSLNGVRVNDEPVSREKKIVPGDVVTVGDVAFQLTTIDVAQRRAAASNGKKKKKPESVAPADDEPAIPDEDEEDSQPGRILLADDVTYDSDDSIG